MPQIVCFLNQSAQGKIHPKIFKDLDRLLTEAVEQAFDLVGKKDVAFDIQFVPYTRDEAPVQIEVHYTAGTDEYKTGKVFDPSDIEKEEAACLLIQNFAVFLRKHGITEFVPSVWIRPQYNSLFRQGGESSN